MTSLSPSHEIIFFFGAGASVEAGIPDTRQFIFGNDKDEPGGFINYLGSSKKNKELTVLSKILDTLKEKKPHEIDLELTLQVLNILNNKNNHHIIHFFDEQSFHFQSAEDIQILKNIEVLLRQFIRENVIAKTENIDYLFPLLDFKPLIIFSVNYDTCIELLSSKYKKSYTDGFELSWHEKLFDQNFDIKLFKLHGSIIWYLTNSGDYLKLPIKSGEIQLISGDIANPFILYPMGNKGQFAEPLSFLSAKLQYYLSTVKTCVIVGYSFRDDDILRTFFEMSKKNDSLKIVLISPIAGEIFNQRLKFYNIDKKIPSSLAEKVICWNYSFGSVLNDHYLYRTLQSNISQLKSNYQHAENARKNGMQYQTLFKDCILQVALPLEDTITIEKIFNKELGIQESDFGDLFNDKEFFKILYSLGILHLFNADVQCKKYFSELINFLTIHKTIGSRYFQLHIEKNQAFEEWHRLNKLFSGDEDNDLLKEAYKKHESIEGSIKEIESTYRKNDSPFYYWSTLDPNFFIEIDGFRTFIKTKIKFRHGIPRYMDLLVRIEEICKKIIEIRQKSSTIAKPFIVFDNRRVNHEIILELEQLFDELITIFQSLNNVEKKSV